MREDCELLTTEDVAEQAYELQTEYCRRVLDQRVEPWRRLEDSQRLEVIEKTELIINTAADPNYASAARIIHDRWLVTKLQDGWRYAPELNEAEKQHPLLLPFAAIPEREKVKDFLFRNVVISLMPLRNHI